MFNFQILLFSWVLWKILQLPNQSYQECLGAFTHIGNAHTQYWVAVRKQSICQIEINRTHSAKEQDASFHGKIKIKINHRSRPQENFNWTWSKQLKYCEYIHWAYNVSFEKVCVHSTFYIHHLDVQWSEFWPFKNQTFSSSFWMPFENQTISKLT